MKVMLNRIQFPVTTLGHGRRIGVWFQGCAIRCPGCVSRDTWEVGDDAVDMAELHKVMTHWLGEADGVTISGGEPFDQTAALLELLRWLRPRLDGDSLVYSGYPWEAIRERFPRAEGLIDALITDPYDTDQQQTLPLRGSDNQRLHRLTQLGEERYGQEQLTRFTGRRLDVIFDADDDVWMAGIPAHGDMARIRRLLKQQGVRARTSQDPPV